MPGSTQRVYAAQRVREDGETGETGVAEVFEIVHDGKRLTNVDVRRRCRLGAVRDGENR